MPDGRTPTHLGPHVVGLRVVVRRVLRGLTGPTGGPAMTDVLGVCESWTPGPGGPDGPARVVVLREDGERVAFSSADIVSGKPVPPRPSRHARLPAADADRRAAHGWPAAEQEPLGEWVLRASGGFSSRANSVLALGDPGLPAAQAVARVEGWYAEHGLPAQAHVLGGEHAEPEVRGALEAAGWSAYEETLLQLASVPRVLRALGTPVVQDGLEVRHDDDVDAGWLATDERAARFGEHARRVLTSAPEEPVDLVTVRDPSGAVLARGRGALDDDWVGVSCLWTDPERRRTGLGTLVLATLLERAAERGATTAYLQVVVGNAAARRTYDRLGFAVHHRYDYLRAPGRDA